MPDFIVFYVDYNEVMHPIIKDIAYKERKINSGGEAFSYSERWLKGMAVSVPPVKKEPFVWNISDFKSSMSFELKSVEYPGMPAQSFSYTWEDVFKTKASRKNGDFIIHCMMDEIGKLHPSNVSGILQFANVRNIFLINSSPIGYNADIYKYNYLLTKDGKSQTHIRRLLTNNGL